MHSDSVMTLYISPAEGVSLSHSVLGISWWCTVTLWWHSVHDITCWRCVPRWQCTQHQLVTQWHCHDTVTRQCTYHLLKVCHGVTVYPASVDITVTLWHMIICSNDYISTCILRQYRTNQCGGHVIVVTVDAQHIRSCTHTCMHTCTPWLTCMHINTHTHTHSLHKKDHFNTDVLSGKCCVCTFYFQWSHLGVIVAWKSSDCDKMICPLKMTPLYKFDWPKTSKGNFQHFCCVKVLPWQVAWKKTGKKPIIKWIIMVNACSLINIHTPMKQSVLTDYTFIVHHSCVQVKGNKKHTSNMWLWLWIRTVLSQYFAFFPFLMCCIWHILFVYIGTYSSVLSVSNQSCVLIWTALILMSWQIRGMTEGDWMSRKWMHGKLFTLCIGNMNARNLFTWYISISKITKKLQRNQWAHHRHQLNAITSSGNRMNAVLHFNPSLPCLLCHHSETTSRSTKLEIMKAPAPAFTRACERTSIKMHSIESRFVIRPSNILSAGMYVCTFQPGNFTGCGTGSEGVKMKTACPLLTWWGIRIQDEVMGPAMQEASLPGLLLQGLENAEPDLWRVSWYVKWTWRICALCVECPHTSYAEWSHMCWMAKTQPYRCSTKQKEKQFVKHLPCSSKCWTNITHIMYIKMENVICNLAKDNT